MKSKGVGGYNMEEEEIQSKLVYHLGGLGGVEGLRRSEADQYFTEEVPYDIDFAKGLLGVYLDEGEDEAVRIRAILVLGNALKKGVEKEEDSEEEVEEEGQGGENFDFNGQEESEGESSESGVKGLTSEDGEMREYFLHRVVEIGSAEVPESLARQFRRVMLEFIEAVIESSARGASIGRRLFADFFSRLASSLGEELWRCLRIFSKLDKATRSVTPADVRDERVAKLFEFLRPLMKIELGSEGAVEAMRGSSAENRALLCKILFSCFRYSPARCLLLPEASTVWSPFILSQLDQSPISLFSAGQALKLCAGASTAAAGGNLDFAGWTRRYLPRLAAAVPKLLPLFARPLGLRGLKAFFHLCGLVRGLCKTPMFVGVVGDKLKPGLGKLVRLARAGPVDLEELREDPSRFGERIATQGLEDEFSVRACVAQLLADLGKSTLGESILDALLSVATGSSLNPSTEADAEAALFVLQYTASALALLPGARERLLHFLTTFIEPLLSLSVNEPLRSRAFLSAAALRLALRPSPAISARLASAASEALNASTPQPPLTSAGSVLFGSLLRVSGATDSLAAGVVSFAKVGAASIDSGVSSRRCRALKLAASLPAAARVAAEVAAALVRAAEPLLSDEDEDAKFCSMMEALGQWVESAGAWEEAELFYRRSLGMADVELDEYVFEAAAAAARKTPRPQQLPSGLWDFYECLALVLLPDKPTDSGNKLLAALSPDEENARLLGPVAAGALIDFLPRVEETWRVKGAEGVRMPARLAERLAETGRPGLASVFLARLVLDYRSAISNCSDQAPPKECPPSQSWRDLILAESSRASLRCFELSLRAYKDYPSSTVIILLHNLSTLFLCCPQETHHYFVSKDQASSLLSQWTHYQTLCPCPHLRKLSFLGLLSLLRLRRAQPEYFSSFPVRKLAFFLFVELGFVELHLSISAKSIDSPATFSEDPFLNLSLSPNLLFIGLKEIRDYLGHLQLSLHDPELNLLRSLITRRNPLTPRNHIEEFKTAIAEMVSEDPLLVEEFGSYLSIELFCFIQGL